jgi:hypothetical protein
MAARTQIAPSAPRRRQAAHTARTPGARELTPDQEKTVRKMLIDGATFEDVVLTLEAQGRAVAQHVVENYFRSDPQLYVLRVQHMLDVARKVRVETKGGDPEDLELADAVIMTGLMRLNRSTALLDVNDALRRRFERENVLLRQQILRLKARNEIKTGRFYDARTRLLSAQYQKAREQMKETIEKLKDAKHGEISGPELSAKIQEIYGLVQAPPVPPAGAPESEN